MKRDIDKIIEGVKAQFPEVRVIQMDKVHPADDDGLWWFRIAGKSKDIQIESPTGECPFLVESDDVGSSVEAKTANTIQEAVSLIVSYLATLQQEN